LGYRFPISHSCLLNRCFGQHEDEMRENIQIVSLRLLPELKCKSGRYLATTTVQSVSKPAEVTPNICHDLWKDALIVTTFLKLFALASFGSSAIDGVTSAKGQLSNIFYMSLHCRTLFCAPTLQACKDHLVPTVTVLHTFLSSRNDRTTVLCLF